jgi:hypothetical protein
MIKPTKGNSSTGHALLRHAPWHHIVEFDYAWHKSVKVAQQLIGNYHVILQTDGYVVYDAYSKIPGILAGCNAQHAEDLMRARATTGREHRMHWGNFMSCLQSKGKPVQK